MEADESVPGEASPGQAKTLGARVLAEDSGVFSMLPPQTHARTGVVPAEQVHPDQPSACTLVRLRAGLLTVVPSSDPFGEVTPAKPWAEPTGLPVFAPQTAPAVQPSASPGRSPWERQRRSWVPRAASAAGS